jgi:hypothetical protein
MILGTWRCLRWRKLRRTFSAPAYGSDNIPGERDEMAERF